MRTLIIVLSLLSLSYLTSLPHPFYFLPRRATTTTTRLRQTMSYVPPHLRNNGSAAVATARTPSVTLDNNNNNHHHHHNNHHKLAFTSNNNNTNANCSPSLPTFHNASRRSSAAPPSPRIFATPDPVFPQWQPSERASRMTPEQVAIQSLFSRLFCSVSYLTGFSLTFACNVLISIFFWDQCEFVFKFAWLGFFLNLGGGKLCFNWSACVFGGIANLLVSSGSWLRGLRVRINLSEAYSEMHCFACNDDNPSYF